MYTFVVAALFCTVARLAQGGVYGEADIHSRGNFLGSRNLVGNLGIGKGDGLHTSAIYGASSWENEVDSDSYGGSSYGYGHQATTSYNSGIIKNQKREDEAKDVQSKYNENDGRYSHTGHNTYTGSGISYTERYDGHGYGYSGTSLKLDNGATSYTKISYGGSKY